MRKVAKTRQLPDGQIQALSSDGLRVYNVSIGERNSCECVAGQLGRACFHWRTALNRYPVLYPAPWARGAHLI